MYNKHKNEKKIKSKNKTFPREEYTHLQKSISIKELVE